MRLFSSSDPFQIIDGDAPIVIGAPHHGVRPNVDADLGTGPIAVALARRLNARAVIVSDLRRTVDINKNPLRFSGAQRRYAVRYQNELFTALPRLVIEIHGHVSGRYAVEVTTGFELDQSVASDSRFLDQLVALRETLPTVLAGKIGQSTSVGVWPIDRAVNKTATDTFTFQKIRRARNLAGAEWYGLHIELNAALRTSVQARTQAFIEALADAFATTIKSSFDLLPDIDSTIPISANYTNESLVTLLSAKALGVVRAPEKYVDANIVVVNPLDLEALGALDGDAVIVRHGHEEIRTSITPSLAVHTGYVALPARIRRQISLSERGHVLVGRPGRVNAATLGNSQPYFIVHEIRSDNDRNIWLAANEIDKLDLKLARSIAIQSQPNAPVVNSIAIKIDPDVPAHRVAVSRSIANQLVLTIGEVIVLNGQAR